MSDFKVNANDLKFILAQIKIAERNAAGESLQSIMGSQGQLIPYGLRTVDGTYNNLGGHWQWGAADTVLPRLTAPVWRNEGDDTFLLGAPGSGAPTLTNNNYASSGSVVDADPRLISNLIVDQTNTNPAAVAAWHANPIALAAYEAANGHPPVANYIPTNEELASIPNLSPDIGLSPSFNGWMTFFGQFFDHGLDLITKGGNGTVYVPLQRDDPLFDKGADGIAGTADDGPNFMALTRATQVNGRETVNTTTPFIDQNQTYTSNASHQVFLRDYAFSVDTDGDGIKDARAVSTGRLLDGASGGIATWAETKAQALSKLGIILTDDDIGNVPQLVVDAYGRFIPGANGFAQIVLTDGSVVEGTAAGLALPANVARTGHAFLDDIAHHAAPGRVDHDHNPATPSILKVADSDVLDANGDGVANTADVTFLGSQLHDVTGDGIIDVADLADVNLDGVINAKDAIADDKNPLTYDDEMLGAHFITGDGRGNENIGLTAVHTIFHAEHNRVVEEDKKTILATGDLAFINEWLLSPIDAVPTTPAEIAALEWNGERLFQAGRFSTEMQYQHLVFEEFARKIQPNVDPFIFSNSADIDPSITAEFAHVVYRFGHSMLTDTIEMQDNTLSVESLSLVEAFLNPQAFDAAGVNAADATAAIVRGMTRVEGNEIDEFTVDSLRNFLVGLPLDLAALNIARGRDTGVAPLNVVRAELYHDFNDAALKPYMSWVDFAQNIKNPGSIVNFVAAYGTHPLITGETTIEGKRAAAGLIVMGGSPITVGDHTLSAPADRVAFLTSTGAWASQESGLNLVDLWIGGLAEEKFEFGGMLGSTFNFVFEHQMENLQNGDRMYYLSRAQGMNLLTQLEQNTFTDLVMRNTTLGDKDATHLPAHLFDTVNYTLELDPGIAQKTGLGSNGDADPTWDDPLQQAIDPKVVRVAPGADVNGDGQADGGVLKFSGGEHVVLGGTEGNDRLIGDKGIDTLWGDGGDDYLNAGMESDEVFGGDGDDVIEDPFGDDFLRGNNGNDVIVSGSGLDVIFGNAGKDFLTHSTDDFEAFAGEDDDFVVGGSGSDTLLGGEGDDWIEGGAGFDGLAGDNSELFFNSPILGNDILNGGSNDTDYDGESGDDIMFQGVGIQRNNGMSGFDWVTHQGELTAVNTDLGIGIRDNQQAFTLRDRNDLVEAASGWHGNDVLTGRQIQTGLVGVGSVEADLLGNTDPRIVGNDLFESGVRLITGLRDLVAFKTWDASNLDALVIDGDTANDILIGGGGSDTMTGKAGDDIIDGDKYLHVYISVRANKDGTGAEIARADTLAELQQKLIDRTYNPGQLVAMREIVSAGAGSGLDTVMYAGQRSDFTITFRPDGRINVVDNIGDEGDDMLSNVERIQFSDSVLEINRAHEGHFGTSVGLPKINEAISITTNTFVDHDGTSTFARQWQQLVGTNWVDIAGATGETFLPTADLFGHALRVVTTYTDARGFAETDVSAATQPVTGNIITGNDLPNTLTGTAGIDVIYGLGANDTLRGLGGNDVLFGGDGNDTLDGGVGADIMFGGAGNDTYLVDNAGDVVDETGGGGVDIVGSTVSYTLTGGVENLTLRAGNIDGTGNELNNIINGVAGNNTLRGLGGNDTLAGGDGNDRLEGGDGNDALYGGAGADTMLGGAGNDSYVVDDIDDIVDEVSGSGTDTVTATISYGLTDGVENLVLQAGNINGTGNGLANTLHGGAGDNLLRGLDGNDALNGNGGNDHLEGGDGNDTLNGGAGSDVLLGGAGLDRLTGGAGNDLFLFSNLGGTDTVVDFDSDATGGQDQVDLTQFGITAATFAGSVSITASGANTIVTVGGQTMVLLNVGAATIDQSDFVF